MALSAEVFSDLFEAKLGEQFPKGFNKQQRREIRKFSIALAEALIEHLAESGEVNVTVSTSTVVSTSDAGLQRDPVMPFTPTLAPATDITLTGTGSGTGTIS